MTEDFEQFISLENQSKSIDARRESITRYYSSSVFDEERFTIATNIHFNSQNWKVDLTPKDIISFMRYISENRKNDYISAQLGLDGEQIKQLTKTTLNIIQIVLSSHELELFKIEPKTDKSTKYKRIQYFSCLELRRKLSTKHNLPLYYSSFLLDISSGIYPSQIYKKRTQLLPESIKIGTYNFIHKWNDQIAKGEITTTGEQLAFLTFAGRFLSNPDEDSLLRIQTKLCIAAKNIDNDNQRIRLLSSLTKYIHIYDSVLALEFPNRTYSISENYNSEFYQSTSVLFGKSIPYTIGIVLEHYVHGQNIQLLAQNLAEHTELSPVTIEEQFHSIRRFMQNIFSYKWFIKNGINGLNFIEHSFKNEIKEFVTDFINTTHQELKANGEI